MQVYAAFYLGKIKLNKRAEIWDQIITMIDGSPFSHVELVVPLGNSEYICYSSSPRDGGVRVKQMKLDPDVWILYPVSLDINFLELIFNAEKGKSYDWLGLIATKVRWFPTSADKWYCSELVAYILNIADYKNYGVKKLLDYVNGTEEYRSSVQKRIKLNNKGES